MQDVVASELALEQRHLDVTYAAYERVLAALAGDRSANAVDEFSADALERMRLERLRAYTAASGPLYFGRIDREHGGPLYIGRHAVADEHNELLAINWRAPAAEPFYAATPAAPRGLDAAPAARRRGHARSRATSTSGSPAGTASCT